LVIYQDTPAPPISPPIFDGAYSPGRRTSLQLSTNCIPGCTSSSWPGARSVPTTRDDCRSGPLRGN